MAALIQGNSEETRRTVPSLRAKGRENAKDTLCRNVTIYGHCRYEDKGCAFNHDPVKSAAPQNQADSVKKRLNVDSPSFTPSSLSVNGSPLPPKTKGLSPKAASAAPFKPKGLSPAAVAPSSSTAMKQYNPKAPDWVAPEVQEFLPQSFSTLATGPNPCAGTFTPSSVSSPRLHAPSSIDPRTPVPVSQDLRSPSLEYQVNWSYGETKGYHSLARHIHSFSEPNREKPFSKQLDLVSASVGSRTQHSLPRQREQKSMYDDPRSRGSPLQPSQVADTRPSKNSRRYRVGGRCEYRIHACPDSRGRGGNMRVHRQHSEPNQRQSLWSTGPTNSGNDHNPLYVPDFSKRLKNDAENHPDAFQQQLSPAPHPPMYNQTRPLYSDTSRVAHSTAFHSNGPFEPISASVFPSHSLSSNQQFHKAQGFFQIENNDEISQPNFFEPFASATSTPAHATPQPQVNPYAQDANSLAGPAYYQGSNSYAQQQIQYHLYAALGPHRELQPNQKTARDFFIPENLRQSLQQQTEATLMAMQNSTLPPTIGPYHTLVPLTDNPSNKDKNLFGYKSWLYKAVSSTDGRTYCLRRIQDYRLTSNKEAEAAIRSVQHNWKRVRNGNVVSVFLSFTNPGFGDSSLIFVTDYHPRSETLAQKHITPVSRFSHRNTTAHVPEQLLWGYLVQLANALKAIHSAGLAARVIDPGKVILTGENRIRLNACAIMDVVQNDTPYTMADLQRLDLYQFGQLIFMLGTNSPANTTGKPKQVIEQFSRFYSRRLQESVSWLLDHGHIEYTDGIDIFLSTIASEMTTVFDASLHLNDELTTNLNRELENSRLVRLLTKLNFINSRSEYEQDQRWSEQGNRFYLSLFRDFVFHQVDAHGNPVLDLGHVIACLNKLDAGSEEKITLVTRDEMTVLVVSYRELKGCVDGAWGELGRRAGI